MIVTRFGARHSFMPQSDRRNRALDAGAAAKVHAVRPGLRDREHHQRPPEQRNVERADEILDERVEGGA